jgi:hypothetical protein
MTDEQIIVIAREYINNAEKIMKQIFSESQKEHLIQKVAKPLMQYWKNERKRQNGG